MPHLDFILLIYMGSHDLLHGFHVYLFIKVPKQILDLLFVLVIVIVLLFLLFLLLFLLLFMICLVMVKAIVVVYGIVVVYVVVVTPIIVSYCIYLWSINLYVGTPGCYVKVSVDEWIGGLQSSFCVQLQFSLMLHCIWYWVSQK